MPGTVAQPKRKALPAPVEVTEPGWRVVLFNDDVTPFEVVIHALQRAAGLSVEVAEMVAVEAHTNGSAVVKRGLTREDAEIVCGGLRKWTRIDGICPGVLCEAQKDED